MAWCSFCTMFTDLDLQCSQIATLERINNYEYWTLWLHRDFSKKLPWFCGLFYRDFLKAKKHAARMQNLVIKIVPSNLNTGAPQPVMIHKWESHHSAMVYLKHDGTANTDGRAVAGWGGADGTASEDCAALTYIQIMRLDPVAAVTKSPPVIVLQSPPPVTFVQQICYETSLLKVCKLWNGKTEIEEHPVPFLLPPLFHYPSLFFLSFSVPLFLSFIFPFSFCPVLF